MRKLFGGIGLSAALVVALLTGSAVAQESYGGEEGDTGAQEGATAPAESATAPAESATVQLTQSRDSGVTGTATLTEVEGGVEAAVSLQGLPEAGVEHLGHIHEGATCADDRADNGGPVEFPLDDIVAGADGTGANTTFIEDVTVSELFSGDPERYINVHAEQVGEDTPPGISCADLVMTTPDGATTVPDTGGPSMALLAALGSAALISAAFVTGLIARRRAA
ncbi:MAG: hypothetical protein H0V53_11950 [Rubrobacter sp.]|nr:hypothetical protein [Rubrobacter sp.]